MEHLIRAFQSTLPVWGATPAEFYVAKHNYISIHAPRVGSDVFTPCTVASSTDFNPRSPCGERRWPGLWGPIRRYFNPRSPCGERLQQPQLLFSIMDISIHAPRVGSDDLPDQPSHPRGDFNPRSPCGERPILSSPTSCIPTDFNPRSPCGERQQVCTKIYLRICNMRESCVHFRRWY